MSYDTSQVINPNSIEYKLERFDERLGRVLDDEFELETMLIGSGYIVELAAEEGLHVWYEDDDIDLLVRNPENLARARENISNLWKDEMIPEINILHVNNNPRIGAPLEIFEEIPEETNPKVEDRNLNERLRENFEDPFLTAFEGDNLTVYLPDPSVYADTKYSEDPFRADIYDDQINTVSYILNGEPSSEFEV